MVGRENQEYSSLGEKGQRQHFSPLVSEELFHVPAPHQYCCPGLCGDTG